MHTINHPVCTLGSFGQINDTTTGTLRSSCPLYT